MDRIDFKEVQYVLLVLGIGVVAVFGIGVAVGAWMFGGCA